MNWQNYLQPDFYHFSEDSTFLAKEAASFVQEYCKESGAVLDLCCGCGIVGIEFILRTNSSQVLHGLDIQKDFKKYFEHNTFQLLSKKGVFFNNSFEVGILPQKYKVILSNPPYFRPMTGRLSPDKQTNLCRHFVDGDVSTLLKFIDLHLDDKGISIFTTRLDQHSLTCFLPKNRSLQKLSKLSKTNLFCMF